MKEIKLRDFELFGQSKSKLTFNISQSGQIYVEKESEDSRFTIQYKKHIDAINLNFDSIRIPKIISPFNKNKYGMEFIHGKNFGEFLSLAGKKELLSISDKLFAYFLRIVDKPLKTSIPRDLVDDKLKKLSIQFEALKLNNCLKLIELVRQGMQEIDVIKGWNHGDLSFENMIVSPQSNQLCFIDFLNSPFESPMFDFGRFWLDLNFGWWFNSFSYSATYTLNSQALKIYFLTFLDEIGIEIKDINLFTAFYVLRIFPYTQSVYRLGWLKFCTARLIQELR